MDCSGPEYVFAAALAGLVIVTIIGTWYHSSLCKILELRHPAIWQFLGNSHAGNNESDPHNWAMLMFLKSDTPRVLKDAQLSHSVLVLRACGVASTVLLLILLGCLLLAPQPDEMMRFGCWLR